LLFDCCLTLKGQYVSYIQGKFTDNVQKIFNLNIPFVLRVISLVFTIYLAFFWVYFKYIMRLSLLVDAPIVGRCTPT